MKSIKDSYDLYKAETTFPVLPKKDFLLICAKFAKFLMSKILSGDKVQLPFTVGTIHVKGNKALKKDGKLLKLAPDWNKTKKLWEQNPEAKKDKKVLYHLNENTNGISYKYYWARVRNINSNRILYSIRMSRANKRALWKNIIEGQEYREDK